MKYLKSYKLFESLIEDITFIRMSHTDMLDGREEGWYQPNQRRMVGPDAFNDSLVKAGFPDKKNCVHFMSESSYDVGYSYIYGKNLFQVVIDDKSKLGWSFVLKKYTKEDDKPKEPKPYKSQPLLTPEDFSSKEEMANFYKTNGSTLKRLKDIMDIKKLDHNEVRQEALKLLDKSRQTL